MTVTAKTVVDSLREVVQDVLIPEMKSVKTSIDSLRTEMKLHVERMEQNISLNNRRLEEIVRLGDEKNAQAIQNLSEKLDFAIDIRERLALLEARLPRQ